MKLSLPSLAALGLGAHAVTITQGIAPALYDRFKQMSTLCMSSYLISTCISPGGLEKLETIRNAETDVNGWILRDAAAEELLLVFRGTLSATNFEQDENYTITPFEILPECAGCQVHGGYYLAWASVYETVRDRVAAHAAANPGYRLVITGHSLGGSLAALAAAQLAAAHPGAELYTLGEPRTGNPAFASFLDAAYGVAAGPGGARSFRLTHEDDGIPDLPGRDLGYAHHGIEYWSRDREGSGNVYVCVADAAPGGEAEFCCEAENGSGINAAHLTYFRKTVLVSSQCL